MAARFGTRSRRESAHGRHRHPRRLPERGASHGRLVGPAEGPPRRGLQRAPARRGRGGACAGRLRRRRHHARAHAVLARAVREAAQAQAAGDHRQAQRVDRPGGRQGPQRAGLQHGWGGPLHRRAGDRADDRAGPAPARGVPHDAARRGLADDTGLRPGRQDARHHRARQPRRQGRQDRQCHGHEGDRLEREPDR